MLSDKSSFEINDLGAGSKQMKKSRTVRDLFLKSSSRGIYGRVLYQLTNHYKPAVVLELGTSIGLGSVHLKAGNSSSHLITVEGCRNTLRAAEKQFDLWNFNHLTTIESDFDSFLKHPIGFRYDLVFIDGNHTAAATKKYMELLKDHTHEHTLFVLDDIRWNNDMWTCWQNFIADNEFHVSIDLGRMGILLRKPQQRKEHFVIRPLIYKSKIV